VNRKLHELLGSLRVKGMANALDEEIKRAEKEGTPVSEVIYRLLLEEQSYRRSQSLLYRLKGARIPWEWTLKTFPFDKQPGVSKAQINELSGLAFVERKENIVFVGNPGTRKSGLAIGLLRQALLSGYRGRFYHAHDLLDELYASLADRSSAKLIRWLCRYDLLVIDELGYLTLKPEQVNAFFKLMGERYGKGVRRIQQDQLKFSTDFAKEFRDQYPGTSSVASADAVLALEIAVKTRALNTGLPNEGSPVFSPVRRWSSVWEFMHASSALCLFSEKQTNRQSR
jgi:DNA replication protein DnaC